MKIEEIEIKKIKYNPYQTRGLIEKNPLKALTQSILHRGLINPISVLKEDENYIVISGHRRLEAYKSLKYKTIPCIVKLRNNNSELIIDLVHENLVREDLTPIEKGHSIKLLLSQIKGTKNDIDKMCYIVFCLKNYENRGRTNEFKLKKINGFKESDIFVVKKILTSINLTCNTAIIYLQILKLPTYIQKELSFKKRGYNRDGKIIISQAQQLVRVEDKEYQKYLFERCLGGTNAKRLQALVNEYKIKLEKGEWKGYIRKIQTGFAGLKNSIEKVDELSNDCKRLSSQLRSFSIDTLVKLEETLEKEEFIIAMKELNNEIILVRNRINEKLAEKGFQEITKKILPFSVVLRSPIKKGKQAKHEKRFTFPMEISKELNIPRGTSAKIKLKVVGITQEK